MKKWVIAPLMALLCAPMVARAGDDRLFRERVAPILERRCVSCHGDASPKGKLALTTARAIRAGGDSGPALVPGSAEESLLLEMVSGDAPEMPQKGEPLSAEEVAILRRGSSAVRPGPTGSRSRIASSRGRLVGVPAPRAAARSRGQGPGMGPHPDRCVHLAGARRKGLAPRPRGGPADADPPPDVRPARPAARRPRRSTRSSATTGPTPTRRLVDRLLASPRYGERWGRHWLDVVHYGDTHGYDKDKRRDHAWPYRDYVIRAFNDDMPYDRFVREQIAGDVLVPGEPDGRDRHRVRRRRPLGLRRPVELREGTVDKDKTRLLDRDDMVANTMSDLPEPDRPLRPLPRPQVRPDPAEATTTASRPSSPGSTAATGPTRTPEAAAPAALEAARSRLRRKRKPLKRGRRDRPAPSWPDSTPNWPRSRTGSRRWPRAGRPRLASPTNGYHRAIAPRPDADAVGPGGPRPLGPDRRGPPGPGPADRLRRHAGLRLPGPLPRRRWPTTRRSTAPDPIADQHRRRLRQPGRRGRRPPRRRPTARFVRVTATRLWKRTDDYVFALGELEVISGGQNVASRGGRSRRSTRSRRAGGAALPRGRLRQPGTAPRPGRPRPVEAARELRARADRSEAEAGASLARCAGRRHDARAELDRACGRADGRSRRGSRRCPRPRWSTPSCRTPPRPIHLLHRGDVEQPGELVGAGRPLVRAGPRSRFPRSALRRRGAASRRPGRWIASPRERADLAVDRQPGLALPLRPGDRRHPQRLRPQRVAAHPPRAARLAGGRVPRTAAVAQGPAPADRHERVVPAVVRATTARRGGDRRRQPLPLAAEPPPARRRGGPRRRARRRRRSST